ncbi:MAG: hypothetical protein ACREVG_04815, partial [Burkholderiales bacterium]
LIQACAQPAEGETLAREVRALEAARRAHPRAERMLLVLDRDQARAVSAEGIRVQPAYEWLLDGEPHS